jgi:16S rRNA (guanine527-N7)-methyltransferase
VTREELETAGFKVNPAAHARLAQLVELLLAENRRVNLTAARSVAVLWRAHVCDSLALLPLLREQAAVRVLDLGAGGGFPGLPLACACPDMEVTLLDATRKKVDAVRRIIQAMGLPNARAVWGRAETLAHDPAYREQFDAVAARAVATLPILLEYAAGFARPGGHCWLFKSAGAVGAEQAAAAAAAASCRLEQVDTRGYRLPGESDDRLLLVYRKHGVLPDDLPRAAGRARKRPL